MRNHSTNRLVLTASAALGMGCVVALIFYQTGRIEPGLAGKPGTANSRTRPAPRKDPVAETPSKSPLELEIGRLSLAAVYARLPAKGEGEGLDLMIGSPEWAHASGPRWTHEKLAEQVDRESVERTRLLFRRLGELEGEEALDFLLEKYGKEEGFTSLAMTFAILGWMEVNQEAAIKAFQQLNRSNTPNLPSMMWKNETVLTGFGGDLRPAIVQFAIREVLHAATRENPERGMALLGEFPWDYPVNFHSGVTGYAQALSSNNHVDWRGLRKDLADLVDDRQRERVERNETSQALWTQEITKVDRTLAQLWAGKDLDEAIDWYVRDLEWDHTSQTANSRTLTVFEGVAQAERWNIMRWIEGNQGKSRWDDSLIVDYALTWAMGPPDDFVDRLVALPVDEQKRIEIVTRYSFADTKDQQVVMRIPADQARRLIEAARLSSDNRTALMKTIDEAVQNSKFHVY